jgi:hypothetical protein
MDNVTPIRPEIAVTAPPKRKHRRKTAAVKAIEQRAEEIREMVFQAQAIVDVSRAAVDSDTPADGWATRNALQIASKLLNTVAGELEPGAITRTGVFNNRVNCDLLKTTHEGGSTALTDNTA